MFQYSRFLSVLALGLCIASAHAAKGAAPDGVPLYPGAREDAPTTEFVRTSLGAEGTAYRTGDALAKVVAFYGQQAGIKPMGDVTSEGAMFGAGCKEEYVPILKKKISKGCGVHVTVQNPWQDMRTGKMNRDTLITIVRQTN